MWIAFSQVSGQIIGVGTPNNPQPPPPCTQIHRVLHRSSTDSCTGILATRLPPPHDGSTERNRPFRVFTRPGSFDNIVPFTWGYSGHPARQVVADGSKGSSSTAPPRPRSVSAR